MKRYAVVFNGRLISKEKEEDLKQLIDKLRKKGVIPKLVSILVGDDKASSLFLSLKKKAADRVGAKVEIIKFDKDIKVRQIIKLIKKDNIDMDVHGIMVQLPLPENFSEEDRKTIIDSIAAEKDVDGMRHNSLFLTPAVKAVLVAIREAIPYLSLEREAKVVVVGSNGFVGKKVVEVLNEIGYKVEGVDIKTKNLKLKTKDADILISATGKSGLIKSDMVRVGAVVIDVGAPKGDVRFNEVKKRASFITPVPGGIGPVTISSLLENLFEAANG